MPLHLIHGPPNTGRTDAVESALRDQMQHEPFLVVPGVDDIFGWEKRLTRRDGKGVEQAVAGGRVMHFRDLCREILVRAGEPVADSASELKRQHFVRKALHREWPELADRLRDQPGLSASVLDLIDELRGEMIDPHTLEQRVADSGLKTMEPLTRVYAAYLDLLVDKANLSDGPRDADRAIRVVTNSWGNRPLFFAGFDDMTPQQLEMIRRISVVAGAEVTVAVAHEPDNPALDWTNELVASLREDARAGGLTEMPTARTGERATHRPALQELEGRFMRPTAGIPAMATSKSVTVLRSSGPRNEAEAIGGEVARLIEQGFKADDRETIEVSPEDIAVAVSSPADDGALVRDVLARYGIPVALEAETAARHTAVGQTVLAILSAVAPGAGTGPALTWLRSPLGPDPEDVDAVEFRARVEDYSSAQQAFESLEDGPPDGWEELTESVRRRGTVNETIARLARETGARLLAMDEALPPSPRTVVEAQVAEAIAAATEELSGIQDSASNGLADIREAIETDAITVWSVPAAGTVRIASPYSLRAKRFKHLFMASQQEGGIRDLDRSGPFLSESDRGSLSMSKRRDPEVQERYLFYSCLTVPTDGLWISCQTSDEAGKAEQPSPLVGSVEDLFRKERTKESDVSRRGRTGSDIVFGIGDSPSLVEAARSIASIDADPASLLESSEQSESVAAGLEAARAVEAETRVLGDLKITEILSEIRDKRAFGATEIEAYAGCPCRWFVERQLRPTDFGPQPDYLAMGSLVHGVLEDLFSLQISVDDDGEHRLGDIYAGESPDAWLKLIPEYIEARAQRLGLGGSDPVSRGNRLRATALVADYIGREATRFRRGPAPNHSVAELELGFGTGGSKRPSVDMGEWELVGKIDRVDLSPGQGPDGREAVAIDYKTGSVSGLGHEASEKARRIQLPLYMHALASMGYVPVASLYVPLRLEGGTARGAYSSRWKDEMMKRGASGKDCVDQLGEFIESGVRVANEAVAGMFGGSVDHDPATCPNHFAHAAVPDSGTEGDRD
jgi:ATP-dependent helicase/DNAse subunit B